MASIKSTFRETQRFNQWWVWTILFLIFFSPLLANLKNIWNYGYAATFSKGLIPHFVTIGLVIVLFALLKMETTIDVRGIRIRYFPFFTKSFVWKDIADIEEVTYTIWQVGGWGLRYRTKFGTVYNVRGKHGIHICLKNEKEYLIGTQKTAEAKAIIEKHMPIKN